MRNRAASRDSKFDTDLEHREVMHDIVSGSADVELLYESVVDGDLGRPGALRRLATCAGARSARGSNRATCMARMMRGSLGSMATEEEEPIGGGDSEIGAG